MDQIGFHPPSQRFLNFCKHTDSIEYSFWSPIVPKNCEHDFPVDGIKGFFEVNKGDDKG